MSEEKRNLHQRVCSVMADIGAIEKGGRTNYGERFAYHRIDDLDDALRRSFVEHGVTAMLVAIDARKLEHFMDEKERRAWYAECVVTIRLANADEPTDAIEVVGWGQGLDYSDKATGKAISYACKAAYLACFHMRGQPDVEEDNVQRQPAAQPKQPPLEPDAIAALKEMITHAADVAALAKIVRGPTYRTLREGGPENEYDLVSRLAKARHAVLSVPPGGDS